VKRIFLVLSLLVLAFSFVGCSSKKDDGKINLPISSNDLKDANYQDVVAKLQNAGFTNVQTKVIDDLVLGWLTKDGEIENVTIGGYTTFSTDSRYPANIEIVVSYHTFPADKDGQATDSPTPDSIVEAEPTEKAQSTEETQSSVKEEIITVDNNKEFAAVMNTKDPGDQIIEEFAVKYAGRTIEFDGNIAYMSQHGDYTTRYDFLIFPWDYSETSFSGPQFRFEDCNYYDLNLIGDDVPDTVGKGYNLHFVAIIEKYNKTSQLFYLDPISTKVR